MLPSLYVDPTTANISALHITDIPSLLYTHATETSGHKFPPLQFSFHQEGM
jgi:hypothetical protein